MIHSGLSDNVDLVLETPLKCCELRLVSCHGQARESARSRSSSTPAQSDVPRPGELLACIIYLAASETPSRAGSVVVESCAESIPWCWDSSRKGVMIEPIKSERNHHHQLLESRRLDCAARTGDDKHQVVRSILRLPKNRHSALADKPYQA